MGKYRLATVEHRGRVFPVVEVGDALVDFGYGYEAYKAATGKRDFFKARHNYTMLDILEEWPLFDACLDEFVEYWTRETVGSLPDIAYRPDEVKFQPPVMYPNKILNAGSNYYDHSLEMGAAAPDRDKHEPYFFYKGSRHNVVPHGGTVFLTPRADYIDWEAELAIVIGRTAKNVSVDDALDYVAGYTCYNDISARDRMIRHGETFDYDWFANKGNDSFAPIGPFITPAKFIDDISDIRIRCYHNGDVVQDFSTSNIVFTIPELIANASAITTLSPGDVIATGTGAGAGMAHGISVNHGEIHKVFEHMYAGKSRLLSPGDQIVVEIDGVGRLENAVAAYPNDPNRH
jgi:2-keto-4-pentenoate hydratase/2-oxohepta-3-ene-1,7-dioic acid hydratase in catechol pathway